MPADLAAFSAPTRAWFTESFAAPTDAQVGAWEAAAEGGSILVSAPTGSGKTLAAFLAALDGLLIAPPREEPGTSVLYVSPLKALAYDVDRNLRAPLVGIRRAAERLGAPVADVSVGMRTGDTPPDERRRLVREPPDILITTPESLFLLLTSRAREALAGVRTVIVDEVHAVAASKRGAHLALSLERLEALGAGGLQRIGLSATQRPLDEVARFLGGGTIGPDGAWTPRPVTIVEASARKELDVEIVVPVEDMSRLGEVTEEALSTGEGTRRSIWPAVHPRILDLVLAHRSTIVFANSRRLAERLCARLNELHAERDPDAPLLARAHHGSVAREERLGIEEALKDGRLRCVVATSSLELGIDMGAVDLVVQVESPGSVASGLQRIGRAGHQVGAPSVGKVFPKYRGDLVECAVVARRMRTGEIELTRYPRNPLDVVAQQIVAMCAMDEWKVDDLHGVVRGAASFAELSRAQLDGVLDMLSGRYPSDEFAELRPRVNWDRVTDVLTGRRSAQRLAVTSGGTIPDRGLYGVFLAGDDSAGGTAGGRGSRRVGELDEEMVYETRPGETIVLGASTWRIEDITRDQVLVTPAPGEPGKLPFWHGDALGRPIEVGRAVGAFLREVAATKPERAVETLRRDYDLDELAAANLVAYVADQREATGAVPSDTTIVIERFRDEIGDWRVVVHSPFGGRVNAPWALAIEARARERLGFDVQTMYADDGIVVRIPEADELPPIETVLVDPDDIEDLVVAEVANSALFASRFRECAGRALLLPRRRPGSRTPLWQQRQKAADLLAVASRYGSFPILLETYREVLRDVYDVPALVEVLRAIATREIRVVQVETPVASPFASSLLFDYIAGYMYEGDAPLAERRASALTLDRELLAELLGSDELRELIDGDALAELELELQRLASDRRARDADGLHDLLRTIGDLRADEIDARCEGPGRQWLDALVEQRRAYPLRVAGEERYAAAEDAARFRDGLGVPPPRGLPEAFLEPVDRPLVDLVARYARTHGPFVTEEAAARLGLPRDAVEMALDALAAEQRIVAGEFRPAGTGGVVGRREWCDAEVLRRLRRRSLATLRREVEPVEPAALARFLPGWQQVAAAAGYPTSGPGGPDRVLEVVEQLQGALLMASSLDRDLLAVRVPRYTPAWLDELLAGGEVVWVGRGSRGADDGRVSLYLRDRAPLLAPVPPSAEQLAGEPWWSPLHAGLLDELTERGPSFWTQLQGAARRRAGVALEVEERELLEALWDLVWAGVVTNDALTPLRALSAASPRPRGSRRRRPGRAAGRSGPATAAGRWSLVADVLADVTPTERTAALAHQLLDRYGVVPRGVAAVEELPGGFSAVYPALKVLEESGRARRGYFIEGLGGAQFCLPGAVDRLRAMRDTSAEQPRALLLAATDPANPYGGILPWPETSHRHTPKRVRHAFVILVEGELTAYVGKGGRSLLTFSDEPADLAAVAEALGAAIDAGRLDPLRLQRLDAEPVADQPVVEHLRSAGFVDHPQGLVRRPARD